MVRKWWKGRPGRLNLRIQELGSVKNEVVYQGGCLLDLDRLEAGVVYPVLLRLLVGSSSALHISIINLLL